VLHLIVWRCTIWLSCVTFDWFCGALYLKCWCSYSYNFSFSFAFAFACVPLIDIGGTESDAALVGRVGFPEAILGAVVGVATPALALEAHPGRGEPPRRIRPLIPRNGRGRVGGMRVLVMCLFFVFLVFFFSVHFST